MNKLSGLNVFEIVFALVVIALYVITIFFPELFNGLGLIIIIALLILGLIFMILYAVSKNSRNVS